MGEIHYLDAGLAELRKQLQEKEAQAVVQAAERAVLEGQLREQEAQAALRAEADRVRALSAKAEFYQHRAEAEAAATATLAHEVNNPLCSITCCADFVYQQLSELDAKQAMGEAKQRDLRRDLQQIQRSSKHIVAVLKDTLDISKVAAGKVQLHPQVLSVREDVLLWAVQGVSHNAKARAGDTFHNAARRRR